MGKKCIVAIDEGTTGTRTVAFDSSGQIVCQSYRTLGISFPKPGWVEQDPAELWERTLETLEEVVAQCCKQGYTIAAIGISNQRKPPKLGTPRLARPACQPLSGSAGAPPRSVRGCRTRT